MKRKLFSELLEEKYLNDITSFSKKRLRRKKVLTVLDDVDDPEQLDVLVADHDRFGHGSRIIITARDGWVLRNIADETYELEGLDFDMGWEIERQPIKESGKHSRLCQEEQLYHAYKNNTVSVKSNFFTSFDISSLEKSPKINIGVLSSLEKSPKIILSYKQLD